MKGRVSASNAYPSFIIIKLPIIRKAALRAFPDVKNFKPIPMVYPHHKRQTLYSLFGKLSAWDFFIESEQAPIFKSSSRSSFCNILPNEQY